MFLALILASEWWLHPLEQLDRVHIKLWRWNLVKITYLHKPHTTVWWEVM